MGDILMPNLNMLDFSQLPYWFVWKDRDFVIRGCSEIMATMLGFKSSDDIVGVTDYDYKCKVAESADKFREQDQLVMNDGVARRVLDIHPFVDGTVKIHLTDKMALRDHAQNIVGEACFLTEINNKVLTDVVAKIVNIYAGTYKGKKDVINNSYLMVNKYDFNCLTKRESEIIFYILIGKTAKMIAEILHISPRTVEKHLGSIKSKMNCQTRADLVMCAIENGFLNCIPSGFLPADINTSILLDDE